MREQIEVALVVLETAASIILVVAPAVRAVVSHVDAGKARVQSITEHK